MFYATSEDWLDELVTAPQASSQILSHGIDVQVGTESITATAQYADGSPDAKTWYLDADGNIEAAAILDWLGY